MKRFAIFLFVMCLASLVSAGVTYQFKSVTEGRGGSTLAGSAAVDGTKMRLEFRNGDGLIFKDGTVAISDDGGKIFRILDPKEKTYYELPLENIVGAFGSMAKGLGPVFKMDITNQKVKVTEAGDGGSIEGYPTRKYLIDSSYDLAMTVMGFKSLTKVETKTESWATDKLDREIATFIQERGFTTGKADFDKMILAQTAAVKGLPLKQITTTTMTGKDGKSQTNVMTTTITNVERKSVPAAHFQIPAGYKQTEMTLPGMAQPE